jgi:hypothetical protein
MSTDTDEIKKHIEEINQESERIRKNCWKNCEALKGSPSINAQWYSGIAYYLLKYDRKQGITTQAFSSSNMHSSTVLEIIESSLSDGTFISLEKATMREYSINGGADVPCCIHECMKGASKGYPKCITNSLENENKDKARPRNNYSDNLKRK